MQVPTLGLNTSKYELWQYRDDANCWDYVREFLLDFTDVPEEDVPPFTIHPDDKKNMTGASLGVAGNFVDCTPRDYAIACQYHGVSLIHVGVVYGGRIWHSGRKCGTRRDKIKLFERLSQKTVYRIHKCLILSPETNSRETS